MSRIATHRGFLSLIPTPVVRRIAVVFAILITLVVTGALVAEAIVTDEVRTDTPIVLDGEVWDMEQIGNVVVVAGNFTKVQTSHGGPIVDQAGLFAYEIDSGIFLDYFRPTLTTNNPANPVEVRDLEPAADGRSVYFGGRFTTVDDGTDDKVRVRNRIAMIDVTSGRLDRNFARGGVDAKVWSLELNEGLLYASGLFTKVYDTDIGRPPLEHDVRFLARFDAVTGGFDPDFRLESHVDIGQSWAGVRGYGIIRATVSNNGKYLALLHRGEEIHNALTGEVFEAPGIALIDLKHRGSWEVTGFRALYPDADDPIQDFYHGNACGKGVMARDLQWDPTGSWFAVIHKGADSGIQCDTVARWTASEVPTRPDWVSRVFDSVYSIGIDDEAIYIGGHFRMMVHPDSPASYPGDGVANGGGRGDIYKADATNAKFKADLWDPGYVYRAYQIGAIDPATGKGIPEWNPGSDAYTCVCSITPIDRGLLVGQDRNILAGFETGRHGFFDNTPDAGDPQCVAALDENDNAILSWTNIGGVSEWNIARNGLYQDGTTATSWTDTDIPVDEDLVYELRFNRNKVAQTETCGTLRVDLIELNVIATPIDDTTIEVDWNTNNADRYTVRRNDVFVATIDAGEQTLFTDTGLTPGTTYIYEIRTVRNGVTQSATATATTPSRVIECVASVAGDTVTVEFNGDEFNRVTIRRDGSWIATLEGQLSYSETLEPGTYSYEATGAVDGFTNTIDCGSVSVGAPAVVCSTAVTGDEVTVSVNGDEFDRVTIRRDGSWIATVSDQSTFSEVLEPGSYAYTATGIRNGVESFADCGAAIVEAKVLACTVQVAGDGIVLEWNDVGATSYQARVNGSWAATISAGTTTWIDADGDAGNTHHIRYRLDGFQTTVACV